MDNSIHAIGFKKTLLSIFIATALTACGGSGGSSSHASDPEKSEAINVQVIDGYLKGAKVFADFNRNYIQEEDEPSDTTNENGVASLNIPSSKLTDIGSIKIVSVSKKGDTNTVLGKPETLAQDIVMSSTIYLENGKAKTQNFVTPFTTLTDLSLSKEESVNMSRDEYLDRLKAIASSIGVNPDVVDSDYNNTENLSKDNVAALVAGELIVRTNLLPVDPESSTSVSELETYTQRTVTDSLSQYKDLVSDIANNTDLSSPEIAEKLTENLKEHEAKLGSSFRVLTSGAADDWRCGVTKTNNVYCWGNNSWGNLGDPEIYPKDDEGNPVEDGATVERNFSAKPVAVKIKRGDSYVPLSGVKSVALGNAHACAVTHVGEVYCWGGNYHGQLGNVPNDQEMTKDKVKSYHAVKVLRGQQEGSSEYLSNIDYLQLGNNHSCALSNNGEVFCWGDNSSYELGGDYEEEFVHKSYDSYDKEIYNFSGQIKLNDWIKNVHVPVKLKFPDSVAKVKFLSSGLWSHCAIVENVDKTDGHNLYCWGSDIYGNITHNYEQYKEDFKNNYEGKFVKAPGDIVYKLTQRTNWYMYDQSGDSYPLYGAPITRIDSYKGIYSGVLDLINVKTVALRSLDEYVEFMTEEEPSVLYAGASDHIYSKAEFTGFEISKVFAPVEYFSYPICLLTTDEKVYCSGGNLYGLLGQGISDVSWGGSGFVKDADGEHPLENVKELSLVKRSYCASVADQKKADGSVDEEQLSLYCWGSSVFGQMGFDNGIDDEWSFKQASDLWRPGLQFKLYNEFYGNTDRIEIKPRKIKDIFENQ